MFFQRKNSKKVKDSNGSQKDKSSRAKNNIADSAKGGFGALLADAEERVETIMHKGSETIEKVKEIGEHSEASQSKELEQGSEEQGKKDMEALNKVIDKVNPEVVEKVKEEVKSLAHALHLGKHEKEPESETTQVGESASASKTEEPSVVEQAVEEIQAIVTSVQTDGTATETTNDAAAAAETSAEGQKPDEATREVEKDDPKKRLDFAGFFAMLLERFCSPGSKKKD